MFLLELRPWMTPLRLFMAQAAYSEADVRAMTDAFAAANPDIKVNLEFVPYEGLHDKTLLALGSGSGYDVVLFDLTGREIEKTYHGQIESHHTLSFESRSLASGIYFVQLRSGTLAYATTKLVLIK